MSSEAETLFTIVQGGIIHRAAAASGKSPTDMLDRLLTAPTDLPLDAEGKEIIRFLPPQLVSGQRGIHKSDVLILSSMPNQHEINACILHVGDLGNVWKPYIQKKGIDTSNWLLYNAVPFKLPDYLRGKGQLKACYVDEGQALLKEVIERAEPKFILLFGSEPLKALNKLLKPDKATKETFTASRGAVLDYPDYGIKAICCTSPSVIQKDPSQLDVFNKDIDLFCELVSTGTVLRRAAPTYEVISTFEQLQNFVSTQIALPFKEYVLDIEWGANHTIRTIQLSWANNVAAVLHFNHEGLVPTEIGKEVNKALQFLKPLFHRDGVGVSGHNVRGDIKFLRKLGLDLMDQYIAHGFDTMLGYHLVPGNETLEKVLKLIAIRLLQVDRWDKPLTDWLKENKIGEDKLDEIGYGTIPDNILIPYGACDAAYTFELIDIIKKQLAQYEPAHNLYWNTIHPLNRPILEMEENGMLVDQGRLRELTDMFRERVDEMRKDLQKDVNWEEQTITVMKGRGKTKVPTPQVVEGFNPDSSDQVKEILFGIFKVKDGQERRVAPPDAKILNLEPVKATTDLPWEEVVAAGKTALYNPSTDAESLGILSGEHQFAKKLQHYKFAGQIVKNYLHTYIVSEAGDIRWSGGLGGAMGEDGRMRTSFRLTLETGRYSTSPNHQIWPKKQEKELIKIFTKNGKLDTRYKTIKSVVKASPGYVLIEADWNQAELWTLGYISGDEKFIHTLQTSDVHTTVTKKMFKDMDYKGRKISDISAKEFNKLRKEDKTLDSLRTAGKSVVFGIPYQRGPKAIAREVSREALACTADDAKGWINEFYTEFDKIAFWINSCKSAVFDPGFVVNPWGRYRTSGLTNGIMPSNDIVSGIQRELINFPIQSTVGDAMSTALCNFFAYRLMKPKLQFRILLSIHDALLFEVKAEDVHEFITEAMPFCMETALEVPKIGLHYTLGDPDFYLSWGEHPDPDQLEDMGVHKDIVDKYIRKAG